jgi:phage I-like protein
MATKQTKRRKLRTIHAEALPITASTAIVVVVDDEEPEPPSVPGETMDAEPPSVPGDELEQPEPAGPPTAFRIFPMGEIETTKGTFKCTPKSMAAIMAAAEDWGNEFSIDYEHAAVGWPSGGPTPAAGWFSLRASDAGLDAVNVRWTERAAALLAAREYRYFSPTFMVDENGEIVELINLALTNLPATKKMEPLMATRITLDQPKGDAETVTLAAERARLDDANRTIAALCEAFGVASAADAVALAKVARDDAKRVVELSARVAELENARTVAEVTAQVDEAIRARRIAPAERDFAIELGVSTPAAFAKYLATRVELVASSPKTAPAAASSNAAHAIDANAAKIMRMLEVTPEAFAKAAASLTSHKDD